MAGLLGSFYYIILVMLLIQGMFLGMTLFGVFIFPMHFTRNEKRKTTVVLARQAAAFGIFPAGIIGLGAVAMSAYATWEVMAPMVESYEKFGMESPSVWDSVLNIQTFVQVAVYILALLQLVPRVRRKWLPFFILTLGCSALYAYLLFMILGNLHDMLALARMAGDLTTFWIWPLAGFLLYFFFAGLYFFSAKKKLRSATT